MNDVLQDAIRDHYDRLSVFYRALWGDHIHHGYWKGDESPARAQEQLVELLAKRAEIPRGAHVLDVGCGIGGSSLWLARQLNCSVLGITLSRVQAAMARERAQDMGLERQVRFEVRDANRLDLLSESFDAVWVIECSEHLADKQGFIENCARVLKPGGMLALCAWLVADDLADGEQARLVEEVCHGMLCPSLASRRDYAGWMHMSGLDTVVAEDLTKHVERTWKLCAALASRPEIQILLRMSDARIRDFVAAFPAIQRAYAEEAMAYGLFVARKLNL